LIALAYKSFYVYEYPLMLRRWVTETGQVGSVLTITEVLEEGRAWKDLDQEVVIRALQALQTEKKAELFEDREGVKFF
jgi:hypothetical protein